MDGFGIYTGTRAQYAPQPGLLNVSMDFNAAPNGNARGTEVVIPDNAGPEVRAAAERYNQMVADFARQQGIEDYPVRGVRTRSENQRGVPYTVHTEPFFNTDLDMQRAIEANPAAFAEIYQNAFGGLDNARLIAPHGVGADRGAASEVFGSETDFGMQMARALTGDEAPQGGNMQRQPQGLLSTPTVSTRGQAPAQEEERKPFFQRPGVANAFDTLAMGLEGMTLNPNQGIIQGAQQRIQQRREMGQMEQQRNRTADWLEGQGLADLAQGVRSGALGARDALTMARGNQQEATAAQRNYEFLVSQGMPPEQAMAQAFGGGRTTVNVGEQGPQIGTIPQGYQVAQDTDTGAYRMEPIPGGPVDQERQADVERQQKIEQQRGTKESVVSRDVDRLIGMIDKGGIFDLPEAGIVGSALGDLGINQEAVTFKNTLSGIQAQVGFDRLQQMREASKTGGALGAVSERELDLLISALGAIQQNTDPQTLKENLKFIRDTMTKIENDPVASQAYYGGTQSQSQSAAPGGGFSVTGVVD